MFSLKSFRISDKQIEMLDKASQKFLDRGHRVYVSDLVRAAIAEYFENHPEFLEE